MPEGILKFPLSAVYKADEAKKAVSCAAIDPGIKTILIRGPPGTAKSVIAKSSGDVLGKNVVNIPSNTSEGDLFGGVDMESSIKEGRIVPLEGLLASAHRNVAVVDDANLMDRKTLYQLLDSVILGRVEAEREGVSVSYPCDTVLIATACLEESDMPLHLLDRFDICVHTKSMEDKNVKTEILRRMNGFSNNTKEFIKEWDGEKESNLSKISNAVKILPLITVSDEFLTIMVELCERMGVDGHRGDLALFRVSRALAALAGRDEVITEDVEAAAIMCLAHRRRIYPPDPEEPEVPGESQQDEKPENPDNPEKPNEPEDKEPNDSENEESEHDDKEETTPPSPAPNFDDMMFNIGEQFRVIDFLTGVPEKIERSNADKGKRKRAVSTDGSGKYSNYEVPKGRLTDLALDATIRSAAPYQKYRDPGKLAIAIEKQDLRQKVREKRTGATIMFVVDASGSLGVRRRMETVKGAVLSMLKDSYVKRDKIGMMAFRRTSAELILHPTHSAEYGYKKLKDLPTGGKTPLSDGIGSAAKFMSSYSRSHTGEKCYIVLITDGRANVPLKEGADANEEVLEIAEKAIIPGLKWIVIDASAGYVKFDNAEKLAEKLQAAYFSIDNLNADKLAGSVRMVVD
ncbi:MAG: VWA domain-containing protein [Candidatus Methanomethylophilaceae archaeon]|jgi:magnesium chelatase subunit D